MPYSSRKTGKNEITVTKKGSGEVVGHTTPEKYDDYMAALHIHSGDSAADGGVAASTDTKKAPFTLGGLFGEKPMSPEQIKQANAAFLARTMAAKARNPVANLAHNAAQMPMDSLRHSVIGPLMPKTTDQYAEGGIVGPYPGIEQAKDEKGTKNTADESNDREYVEMPHLDEGGILTGPAGGNPDDDFSVNTGDSSTLKGLPMSASSIPPQNQTPEKDEGTGMTQMQVEPPGSHPQAPKMPGMPPGVTPDDLKGYLDAQRAKVNRFTPEAEFAQQRAIQGARTGLGGGLANAGAGLADAIMQGVARAGNPGFQQNLQEQGKNLASESADAFEQARKGEMESVEANQKIDAQDPTSPISRMAQKAIGPQLVAAGLPQSAIPFVSASLAEGIASRQVTLAEAMARINEEATFHKAQIAATAGETVAKMGPFARFTAPKGIIEALTRTATGQEPAGKTDFATEEEAKAAGLPPGSIVRIAGRRARID